MYQIEEYGMYHIPISRSCYFEIEHTAYAPLNIIYAQSPP